MGPQGTRKNIYRVKIKETNYRPLIEYKKNTKIRDTLRDTLKC